MAKHNREENGRQAAPAELKGPVGPDDLIQEGARQIVQQAIEAELKTLLERYSNVKTLDGRQAIVRNGYLPERTVVTAIGPVTVQSEGPRSLGVGREVQLGDRAAVRAQVAARIVGAAVAVSARHLDRRHERGAQRVAWRAGEGLVSQYRGPLEVDVGGRIRAMEQAELVGGPLGLLVGRRNSHGRAQRRFRRAMSLLVIVGVKPDGSKERGRLPTAIASRRIRGSSCCWI